MSKLQELIDRLCPDGVEFKPLGEVCEFQRGDTLSSKDAIEGDVPVMAGGQKPSCYHNVANRSGETIVVAGSGAYAGFVTYWNIPVFVSDAFTVNPSNCMLPKYVFYFLKNNQEKIHATKKGAGVPHVHGKDIAKFLIPVPPIEVQEEIVKILDRFADYAAELQAELQARKEQYEYYRNLLLTFNSSAYGCGTDDAQKISVIARGGHSYEIQWKTMGEIGKFFGGLTGKSKADFSNGNARFISYMNVYSNIALDQSANEFVSILPDEKQNVLQYGDALFTGSSETPNECGMSSVVTTEPKEPLYLNSFSFGFRLDNISTYHPDFLKHLLRSTAIRDQIAKTANGVTRFNVSKALFAKIILPIPPIELQVKIASILDRFETLVNDISKGLPAEIEAVKARYEYYRNKLLTFNPLSA